MCFPASPALRGNGESSYFAGSKNTSSGSWKIIVEVICGSSNVQLFCFPFSRNYCMAECQPLKYSKAHEKNCCVSFGKAGWQRKEREGKKKC